MLKTARELRSMADECRELAAATKNPEIREQLLEIADQIERLAQYREYVAMTTAGRPKDRVS